MHPAARVACSHTAAVVLCAEPCTSRVSTQGLLADTKFLDTLRAYDKDNIPPAIITAVRPYMDMPEFEPSVVKKASAAAYGLCSWVRAMEAYDRVAKVGTPRALYGRNARAYADARSNTPFCTLYSEKGVYTTPTSLHPPRCYAHRGTPRRTHAAPVFIVRAAQVVAPKKAKLAEAEAEYSELMVGLNAKKAELAELEAKLAALNAKLAEMQARKVRGSRIPCILWSTVACHSGGTDCPWHPRCARRW